MRYVLLMNYLWTRPSAGPRSAPGRLRAWPSHGTPASPDAWLLTVARNRLRDHWKSAQAQRTIPLDGRQDSLAAAIDLDVDALPDRRLGGVSGHRGDDAGGAAVRA
jgi:DNA-directed RNA polymerase specialized sigma24 family protein